MKKFYTLKELKNPAGTWLLAVIISLLVTGLLAPTAVWISLDTSDILYQNRQMQAELDKKKELSEKLEIEAARLLSPYELKKKAEHLGMGQANAGQVRRITIYEKTNTTSNKSENIQATTENKEIVTESVNKANSESITDSENKKNKGEK